MKLLITGGHVTPALACIDEIRKKRLPIELYFVGRRYANEREKEDTFEYKEISNRNIPFTELRPGRVTRNFSLNSISNIFKIPSGFRQASHILEKIKPDAVLSFGGYIAVPIAAMAALKGIPVYTHEQTIHPGVGNKLIASFSQKIFISFAETMQFFPAGKIILTGNPVRQEVFEIHEKPFEVHKTKPVIYVTGGSIGAHSINLMIEKLLPDLLKDYIIIHQSGNIQEYHDYERLNTLKLTLPEALRDNYFVGTHFLASEIGYLYSLADLVIGRAGANTFFEILALQKPALFIPLPLSAHHEQQKHARIVVEAGAGEMYEGENPQELYSVIHKMMNNLPQYRQKFTNLTQKYDQNAAEKIIATIYQP